MTVTPPPVVLGGVGLIKGNVKNAGPAMVAVATAMRKHVPPTWFADQPFIYVHLILRFGEASERETEFQRLNRRYRELPLARTLAMRDCQDADREGRLTRLFMQETVVALRDLATKYSLDSKWLDNPVILDSDA